MMTRLCKYCEVPLPVYASKHHVTCGGEKCKKAWHRAAGKAHYEANKLTYFVRARARKQDVVIRSFPHEAELVKCIYEDRDLINRIFPHVRAQVDHIVPIKHDDVCGLHVVANLQLMRGSENDAKCNRWADV